MSKPRRKPEFSSPDSSQLFFSIVVGGILFHAGAVPRLRILDDELLSRWREFPVRGYLYASHDLRESSRNRHSLSLASVGDTTTSVELNTEI
jgi:hypothetical protein